MPRPLSCDRDAAVDLQGDRDGVAEPASASSTALSTTPRPDGAGRAPRGAHVHAGPLAHRLEALERGDRVRAVAVGGGAAAEAPDTGAPSGVRGVAASGPVMQQLRSPAPRTPQGPAAGRTGSTSMLGLVSGGRRGGPSRRASRRGAPCPGRAAFDPQTTPAGPLALPRAPLTRSLARRAPVDVGDHGRVGTLPRQARLLLDSSSAGARRGSLSRTCRAVRGRAPAEDPCASRPAPARARRRSSPRRCPPARWRRAGRVRVSTRSCVAHAVDSATRTSSPSCSDSGWQWSAISGPTAPPSWPARPRPRWCPASRARPPAVDHVAEPHRVAGVPDRSRTAAAPGAPAVAARRGDALGRGAPPRGRRPAPPARDRLRATAGRRAGTGRLPAPVPRGTASTGTRRHHPVPPRPRRLPASASGTSAGTAAVTRTCSPPATSPASRSRRPSSSSAKTSSSTSTGSPPSGP